MLGILNMAMIEYQLAGPNPKHRTTVVKLVKSLDGMTRAANRGNHRRLLQGQSRPSSSGRSSK
jgi:hypothetical protein